MGMAPRTPSNGGRPYPAPHPPRRPPSGGSGEARAADGDQVADGRVVGLSRQMPVLVPPGADIPTWAVYFLTGHTQTGPAARLRDDPAVRDFLDGEADRIAHSAVQGAPVAVGRRARAAEWTYSPRDAGWVDIVLDAPDAAWSRWWDWNRRVFAHLAARLADDPWGYWLLAAAAAQVIPGVMMLDTGETLAAGPWALAAALLAVAAVRIRPRADSDRAMVARVCADMPDPFTWRDVEPVEFTAVCECPSCDVLDLHHLTPAGQVPDHDRLEPLVWRTCRTDWCAFTWPQLR